MTRHQSLSQFAAEPAANVGRLEVLGQRCLVWTCSWRDMQQHFGLTANTVCHKTAVLPLASCSSPGGMTRTHAKSVECPVVVIVERPAVASAESSMTDICLRCAVWGQDDCQRTRRDYMYHWLVELLHHRREEQELTKFFNVALCTNHMYSVFSQFSFSLFDLIHAQSSSVHATKAPASALSSSGAQ